MAITLEKWLCGFLLLVVLFGCEKWGTLDEATRLYFDNKNVFVTIDRLVKENRNLENITNAYDPYGDIEFLPVYGKLDDRAKAAYADVVKLMASIGLDRVRIDRFKRKNGSEIEIVNFVVFARGIGGGTEYIGIAHLEGDNSMAPFLSPSSTCKSFDEKNWYVCHVN